MFDIKACSIFEKYCFIYSEITNFTDMGISIDKNSRIIWEIERINDEELACVGIESKINN